LNECFHDYVGLTMPQLWLLELVVHQAKIGFKCLINIDIQEKNCITHVYPSIEVHVTITCHSSRITPQCFLDLFDDCFELWMVAYVDVHFGILGI